MASLIHLIQNGSKISLVTNTAHPAQAPTTLPPQSPKTEPTSSQNSNPQTVELSSRITTTTSKREKNLPGPGMYRLPSEFGYYEAPKKARIVGKKRRRARSVEMPGDRK